MLLSSNTVLHSLRPQTAAVSRWVFPLEKAENGRFDQRCFKSSHSERGKCLQYTFSFISYFSEGTQSALAMFENEQQNVNKVLKNMSESIFSFNVTSCGLTFSICTHTHSPAISYPITWRSWSLPSLFYSSDPNVSDFSVVFLGFFESGSTKALCLCVCCTKYNWASAITHLPWIITE